MCGLAGAWRVLGQIAARAGEPIIIDEKSFDAAECFKKSLPISTKSGIEAEKAKTLSQIARFERTGGNSEKADAMTDEAREISRKLKMVYEPSEDNSKGRHIQ